MTMKVFVAQQFDESDLFFAKIKRIDLQAMNEGR